MENPTLEKEIADIEQRLAAKKAELNKEEVHSVVKEQVQEKMPEYLPRPSADIAMGIKPDSSQAMPEQQSIAAPSYLSEELKSKVQELVNIAFTQSISDAVKAASKINNPALIDAFHDVLVDQLYNTLIERGKLKKI